MSPLGRLISVFLVLGAALLQLTSFTFLWGVKPNLTLILILLFSVAVRSWTYRLILLVVGGTFLKFYAGKDISTFIFPLITMLAILLTDYLPWQSAINYSLAVITATVILNIPGSSLGIVFLEAVYNLVLFWTGHYILSKVNAKKI